MLCGVQLQLDENETLSEKYIHELDWLQCFLILMKHSPSPSLNVTKNDIERIKAFMKF